MMSFQDAPTNIFRMSKETRFVLVLAAAEEHNILYIDLKIRIFFNFSQPPQLTI